MTVVDNHLFAACSAMNNTTVTENNDLTHVSSLDACVDFFYTINDTSSEAEVHTYIAEAWQADPKVTLRLVFYLLDVREGKSCTHSALYALQWLFEKHPRTLLGNAKHIATFGCVRDYATLLMMVRCTLADGIEFGKWREEKVRKRQRKFDHDAFYRKARKVRPEGFVDELHRAIVAMFVTALVRDKRSMEKREAVSLFSKWIPSQDSYLNRTTRLFDDVAMAVYERDCLSRLDISSEAHRRPLIHARNHLRKAYVSPLRKHAEIVERLMSDGQWNAIRYPRVPSKSMSRNAAHFLEHDKERYSAFLASAAEGKAKVNVGTLKPHEICFPPYKLKALPDDLRNAQWDTYVASMKEHGALDNAVAICDVSGSMSGEPMEVAISLGLLIATVAKEPWRDHLITFSQNPTFHAIRGTSLTEKVDDIGMMDWGYNTNFDRVFDQILSAARKSELTQKDMPTTLFVFSDMQFDEADPAMKSTGFERIRAKFAASGYEMPQIVFWNLRNSYGVPVTVTEEGTALVSGFSGNLLKLFLTGQDFANLDEDNEALKERPKMTPVDVMRKAIDDERFDVLVVLD